MRALAVARSDFSARTKVNRRTGEYGRCICSPKTAEAIAAVVANADALAEAGFSVHIGERWAFFGTSDHGAVYDHRGGAAN